MTFQLNRESPNTPYKKPMEKFAMSQKLSVVPGVSELVSGLLKVKTRINTEAFLGDASEEFQSLATEEIGYLNAAIAALEASTTDNARLKAEIEELIRQVPRWVPGDDYIKTKHVKTVVIDLKADQYLIIESLPQQPSPVGAEDVSIHGAER